MNTEVFGKGETSIVLLHGGPSLYGYMASLGKLLEDDYRIIDFSQRGTYENPCSLDEVSVEHHLRDLEEVVGGAGTDKVVLIGHSWGAYLALAYGAKHPQKLVQMILLGSAPLTPAIAEGFADNLGARMQGEVAERCALIDQRASETKDADAINQLMQERLELLTPLYAARPDHLDSFPASRWHYQSFVHAMVDISRWIEQELFVKAAQNITIPVHAFHGAEDPIPAEPTLAFLAEHLPSVTSSLIPGSGHFPWLETPVRDTFVKQLREALASCRN